MNGFPKTLLVDAFKACPSMFGKHTECPTLNKFTQSAQASDCQMKGDIVNEVSTDLSLVTIGIWI